MSVLARLLEAAGLPTVIVTMMPSLAEALGAPRIVGVEFPFGHPFGLPQRPDTHDRVLSTAVTLLAGATQPGVRVDIDIVWPIDLKEAYRSWQPAEPSPIVAAMIAAAKQRRAEEA